jgi:hypothetical protein
MAATSARVAGRVILDTFVEKQYLRGSASLFSSVTRWIRDSQIRRDNANHTRLVAGAFPKTDPFSKTAFISHAQSSYESLLNSITAGHEQRLRSIVSEGVFPLIRRGMRLGVSEHGARQGARIVQWLEAPAIVQTRAGYDTPELTRGFFERPTFGQITVRFSTLQQPSAFFTRLESDTSGHPESQLHDWYPVLDAGTGLVYWANDAGACQWDKPPSSALVQRAPFRLESAGYSRSPEVAPSGERLVRVKHHVVFEKAFTGAAAASGASGWRIVRL